MFTLEELKNELSALRKREAEFLAEANASAGACRLLEGMIRRMEQPADAEQERGESGVPAGGS